MMSKFTIEFTQQFNHGAEVHEYRSDDPVSCEEFLEELLEKGYHIRAIRHAGVDLPGRDFDKMVKTAAGMLASKVIRTSLGISTEEEHFRFGFTG